MNIRPLDFSQRHELKKLIDGISLFTDDERAVVIELLEETKRSSDYIFWGTWEDAGELSAFICYGPTPMTEGTFDMYWIGTKDKYQKMGRARMLVEKMKNHLQQLEGRLIRIETSGQETYASTRLFYDKMEMLEVARIKDFYHPDDDLVIYAYYF